MSVTISVSWGEFIDRITILEIKAQNIPDPEKTRAVEKQLAGCRAVLAKQLMERVRPEERERIVELESKLMQSNRRIWAAVNTVNLCIDSQDLGPEFVEAAKLIHEENNRRSSWKGMVDELTESDIQEIKYHETKPVPGGRRNVAQRY